MAKLYTAFLFTAFLLYISSSTLAISKPESDNLENWFRTFPRLKPKFTILHYYLHGVASGPNANIWEVARAARTAASPTEFGLVRVLDDKVTATPDRNSTELGRTQGTMTSVDLQEVALAMSADIVFMAGPYNGSSFSVVGRNPLGRDRELPIVGGTGIFRMARGSLVEDTYSYDPVENYWIMEHTAYVYYYV